MTRLTIFCLFVLVVQATADMNQLNTFLEGYGEIANPRIVGGSEAVPHAFPYQAAVFIKLDPSKYSVFCGGSLISDLHVLTAAHCVDAAVEAAVFLGAHNLTANESTRLTYFSKSFIVHKGWKPSNFQNDIAIIVLPDKLQFNGAIQPIRLPKSLDRFKILIYKIATVSGWGRYSDDIADISPELRYVERRIYPLLICISHFGPFNVGFNQICLQGTSGKSPCQGDSGGPLVINENGVKTQVGIVSFGTSRGCEKGYPVVFTRVSNYISWIQENTGLQVGK